MDTTSATIDDLETPAIDGKGDDHDISSFEQYFVPVDLIERLGSAMGILIVLED